MKYYLQILSRDKYPTTLKLPDEVILYTDHERILTEIAMLLKKLPQNELKDIQVNLFKTQEKILSFEL